MENLSHKYQMRLIKKMAQENERLRKERDAVVNEVIKELDREYFICKDYGYDDLLKGLQHAKLRIMSVKGGLQ